MPAPETPIAFVGIGAIGLPMAIQLATAGYRVTGVDPFEAARERATASGLTAAASLADAGAPEIVIVMVATPDQLTQLVDDALAAGNATAATWVIMSTVGPESVTAEAARLQAAGARVVDAPVTGGVARARTGELTIFASGAPDAVAAATPALSAIGTVRVVGDEVGQGQGIKVVNQHLCAVHIVAAAEALALADSLGLSPDAVLPLLESGAAGSWMLTDRGPRMLQGTDVEVASQVNIFVKDTGLVADAARESGAATPLLNVARDRFLTAADAGLGVRDDSRVIETYTTPTPTEQTS